MCCSSYSIVYDLSNCLYSLFEDCWVLDICGNVKEISLTQCLSPIAKLVQTLLFTILKHRVGVDVQRPNIPYMYITILKHVDVMKWGMV